MNCKERKEKNEIGLDKRVVSAMKLKNDEAKIMGKKYELKNVAADGNCCYYVAINWLVRTKRMKNMGINGFRKEIREYFEEHHEYLTSSNFGSYKLYHNRNIDEFLNTIYRKKKDFRKGCDKKYWAFMLDIYPILVEKYGYFKLIIVSDTGTFLYDIKCCKRGMIKWFGRNKWLPIMMSNDKDFEKHHLVTFYNLSHYQEICRKN